MGYKERVANLADMRRRNVSARKYFDWLYSTKRGLVADTYGKTELQMEADVRSLLASDGDDA